MSDDATLAEMTEEQAKRQRKLFDEEVAMATQLLRAIRFNYPDVTWAPHTTEVDRQMAYVKTAADRLVHAAMAQPVIKARFRDNDLDGVVSIVTCLAEGIGNTLRGIPVEAQRSALEHVLNRLIESAGAVALLSSQTVGEPDTTRPN